MHLICNIIGAGSFIKSETLAYELYSKIQHHVPVQSHRPTQLELIDNLHLIV